MTVFPMGGFPQQNMQQMGGFPQQMGGFPMMPAQPPAPHVDLPTPTLADLFAQPVSDRPKAYSWKDAPVPSSLVGTVVETVTDRDVTYDLDMNTKAPKTNFDGSPRLCMIVTVRLAEPNPNYPEGEVSLYVKGQMASELNRAVAGQGRQVPTEGDLIAVTLVEKRPNPKKPQNFPMNVFSVQYQAQNTTTPVVEAPVTAPVVEVPAAPVAQNTPVSNEPSPQDMLAQLRSARA